MGVGGIFVTLRAFTDKFRVDMKKAGAAVKRFSTSTVNINRQLKKVGKAMSRVGRQMSTSFSLPIVAAGGLAVKTFADFEQEMAKVAAVSGATGAEFKKLEKLATDLGASTRFTASEVAALQLNYSKLGFVPAEIQKITGATLDLALATGEDLADSAEVAGGTLRAFGMDADQMQRVVDLMAKSFSSSALNLEKFRDSMKSAGPVANAVGASLEDTTAIMSTLVDANIDASTAGTSLRNIFLELSAKGLTWNQAMKKIKGSTDKAKTANELFGKRAVAAALVIANNTEKLDKLKKEYKNAGGAAKKMATIMDNTLQGAMLRVKSAVEGAAIELGNTLAPVIKKVGEFIANLANKFSALSPATKKTIAIVAGLVAAIGPLLVVLGFLTSTVLPALVTGLAVLTGPIGLVVLGIAALAAGFIALHLSANQANKELSLSEKVTNRINSASDKFNTKLKQEQNNITSIFDALKDENTAKETRLMLINDINSEYGDYLPSLLTESSSLEDIEIAQNAINKSMTKRLALMLGQEEVVAVVKEFRQEEKKLQEALKRSGLPAQTIKSFQEGFSSLEELSAAYEKASGKVVEYEGQMESVVRIVTKLNDLDRRRRWAIDGVTKAYEDLITTTDVSIKPKKTPLGDIGGIGDTDKGPKKAKAIEGKELIPLIVQLQRARDEAELFSKAFSDEPAEALQRQRDALKTYIAAQLIANENAKAAFDIDSIGYKENVVNIEKQIAAWNELGEKIDAIPDKVQSLKDTLDAAMASLKEAAIGFRDAVVGTVAGGIGEALGAALDDGDGQEAVKAIFKNIFGLMKQFGAQMIKIGIPLMLLGIPLGFQYTLGGTALIAAASFALAQFAEGGLVFGETLGIIGEGRGTTRSNPEVIAPLDKLQGMLGGGGKGGVTEFVLRGETLRAITNKVADNRSFTVRE